MANRLRRCWTVHFLRELVFTGDARTAAHGAAVYHSHVWMRRLKEPKFAGLWDAALRLHAEFREGLSSSPSHRRGDGSLPLPQGERSQ